MSALEIDSNKCVNFYYNECFQIITIIHHSFQSLHTIIARLDIKYIKRFCNPILKLVLQETYFIG